MNKPNPLVRRKVGKKERTWKRRGLVLKSGLEVSEMGGGRSRGVFGEDVVDSIGCGEGKRRRLLARLLRSKEKINESVHVVAI